LCEFLEIGEKEEMSRTEVTKRLIKYIKEKGLYKSNKIIKDTRLSKILKDEEITFFSIQNEMNKHYIS
jgi:chromatin remodeling complex protein RSC6